MSTATATAVQNVQRGRCLAAQAVRIEKVIGKIPKTRFPNSMKAWASSSGKKAPSSQPGHPSQPRPDPVRRTSEPVMTMT